MIGRSRAPFHQVFAVTGISLAGLISGVAHAAAPVSFGTPSWPGVTVKTEVVEQLLQALGYQTKTRQVGLPFVYRGLAQGNIDVFLGAWLPTERQMLDPLLAKNQVVKLSVNLPDAVQGLAVPEYVWKQGIHTIQDVAQHPALFNHKIYGIETGSAMNQAIAKAIKNNYEGLGGFQLIASSTAVMLAQVEHSEPSKTPIVFDAWKPHWMNIKFHIRYLKDDNQNGKLARQKSTVYTLVSSQFKDQNVRTLLQNVKVSDQMQSRWIYDYSYKKEKASTVAHHWLATHGDTVNKWLANVKTRQGGPSFAAYQKAFGK